MPRVKTAPLSTSCPASILKAARSTLLRNRPPKTLTTDYLSHCVKCLPNRGEIGIFNRSYYEEILVVRVHPDLLAKEKIPPSLKTENIWNDRFEEIRSFERETSYSC